MNKIEIILIAVITVIFIAGAFNMPQYSRMFIFLLALDAIYVVMTLLADYRKKYENTKLSILFCLIGIILFIMYFINSVNMDLTNKGSMADSLFILILFTITMSLGWFFEKNSDES